MNNVDRNKLLRLCAERIIKLVRQESKGQISELDLKEEVEKTLYTMKKLLDTIKEGE